MTVLRSLQLEFVPVVHKLQRLRNAAIQIKMYLLSLQTELGEITNVISTLRCAADMLYLLSGYCRHVM